MMVSYVLCFVFFFQAEDGIRYLVRSRGLGDVYKRQACTSSGRRTSSASKKSRCQRRAGPRGWGKAAPLAVGHGAAGGARGRKALIHN